MPPSITILPSFSKLYERVIYKQLLDLLISNNLSDDQQHWFRSEKSVVTAGIDVSKKLISFIEKGTNVLEIFLDLTRVFGSVFHKIIIQSLQYHGIEGKEFPWLKSYLDERKLYVKVDHKVPPLII